ELVSPKVEIALPDAAVAKVALKMRTSDVGFVPVCEDRRVIGVVTDRDIVVRGIAEGKDPAATPVSEIMTADPVCVSVDATLAEALELMRSHKIRRLPAVAVDGKIVGVLTLGDVASRGSDEMPVQEALAEIRRPQRVASSSAAPEGRGGT